MKEVGEARETQMRKSFSKIEMSRILDWQNTQKWLHKNRERERERERERQRQRQREERSGGGKGNPMRSYRNRNEENLILTKHRKMATQQGRSQN